MKRAAALLIALYFLGLTHAALFAGFSLDDMMNLYRAWSPPLGDLVKANLLFFETSEFYRPLGEAWYRIIYYFAGFHPAPFHAVNLAIVAANVFLTYAVARRLSGSREIGAVAALLGCYHPKCDGLYFDTGFIYDVLCYFFYFAAFLLYLRVRQAGRELRGWPLAACVLLFICALSAKEMAVTLPLFLLIYELLYGGARTRACRVDTRIDAWRTAANPCSRPGPSPARLDARRLLSSFTGTLVTGAITLLFVIGRTTGPNTLLHNAAYGPVFTAHKLMETSIAFLNDLFLRSSPFTAATALLLWVTMFAVACVTRSRPLRFAWLFLTLAPAPIAFLLPRGAAQYYVPMFGWFLYAATALVQSTAWIAGRVPAIARVRAPLLFGGILAVLYPYYRAFGYTDAASFGDISAMIRSTAADLRRAHPALAPGSRLFFLDDPFEAQYEDLPFIVRLAYREDHIGVDRLKRIGRRPDDDILAGYDAVFAYRGGRFVEVTPAGKVLEPALLPGEIYHADWAPVSATRPAAAGEVLIAKATGLGKTTPPVGPEQPFPQEPLARVIAQAHATVNGRPAEVVIQLGWPGEIGIYRVDIRVPESSAPGAAALRLSVRGVESAPVALPIR